jgi:predicted Ser/Thr protein kinase
MDKDVVYKRTYSSLRIHAFRNNGYLAARDLKTLNLPTTPEVLEDVLLHLQAECLLKVIITEKGETIYDFLPLLEKTVEESVLDAATRFQLAKIYLHRQMWTHTISELRFTRTHPKFKKESLYLLGRCFEQKGAFEKARENYERLLAVDYYYLDTLERLSKLVEQQEQPTVISPVTTVVTTQQQLSHVLQDRYEVVRELGRGGAGVVYQAIDLKLKRDVALKVLYQHVTQSGDMLNFLQEARLAAQLEHPNIVDVYDVNVESQFIAMEFVDGGTLRDMLKTRKCLPLDQARSIIIQLCHGLQVAHNAGILHRDIKPANIFVTKQKKVKLGDFGIAHIANVDQDAFTQISAQIGTLPYMSPEQVQGGMLSIASDIYAVGIVFYEMLTGAPPFTQGDIAYHHLYSPPPPPGISAAIDTIILRCLEKNPSNRFQSAEELSRTLQHQEQEEQKRLDKYRELLKVALLDKELTDSELLVLKLKRKSLNLTDQEAHCVEQEFGINLPS